MQHVEYLQSYLNQTLECSTASSMQEVDIFSYLLLAPKYQSTCAAKHRYLELPSCHIYKDLSFQYTYFFPWPIDATILTGLLPSSCIN